MNITRENHDEVSALLTLTLNKDDYKRNVEETLLKYSKSANIPGFRKGRVPLSLIRKQYEAGITYEEINKQVSEGLNKYITDNKLRLLGQAIPQPIEELDYDKDSLVFKFEIGFEPEISIDLSKYEAPYYVVNASEEDVEENIKYMRERFAKQSPVSNADEDTFIAVKISSANEEENPNSPKYSTISNKNKEAFDLLNKKVVGDKITLTKEELQKTENLADSFHIHNLDEIDESGISLTVEQLYKLELDELNQDFFDKIYGKDSVKSEEEFRERVKSEIEKSINKTSEIYFFNKAIEQIIEKEEIKIPEDFLVKWIIHSNEQINSEEEAKNILEEEIRQIKYQIVQGSLALDNNISIEYSDVLEHSKNSIRQQLENYGILDAKDEEIQKYAIESLKDQEQLRQKYLDVTIEKLKDLILKKVVKKEEKISNKDFLEKIKN